MTIAGVGQTTNATCNQEQGRDTWFGLKQTFALQNIRNGNPPLAEDPAVIVAAVLPLAGSNTFTVIAQPDVPRTITATLTSSGPLKIVATVRGKDYDGNPISEPLIVTDGTPSMPTTQAFFEVDSIKGTAVGTIGGGDTISFGVGPALGIPARLGNVTDIIAKRDSGSGEDTTGVIIIAASGWATWNPATPPDTSTSYFITVQSSYGVK